MIKPQSSKAKGRKLQQWVRDTLLKIYTKLEPDDIKSTGMGQSGEDVQLSPQARKLIPYSIECKARNKIAVYNFYDQALTNNKEPLEAIVVIKQDRRKPLVILDAENFFNNYLRKDKISVH